MAHASVDVVELSLVSGPTVDVDVAVDVIASSPVDAGSAVVPVVPVVVVVPPVGGLPVDSLATEVLADVSPEVAPNAPASSSPHAPQPRSAAIAVRTHRME